MKPNKNRFIRICVLFIATVTFWNRASGQILVEEEPKRLYYSFAIKRITKFKDMKDFRDVFHLNKYYLGKNRITGNFAYNTGRVLIDDGKEMHKEIRSALSFYSRIRFYEQFSFNTTFYFDFNKKATARWTSDYSYSIGRYNWKSKKFSYGYENYINNKYSDNLNTFYEKFLEGFYFVSYSNFVTGKFIDKIKLDNSTNIKLTYFARYAIHYRDEFEVVHGGVLKGKPSGGIAARFTIFKNIYAESAVYFYLDPKQRQPWDPDYSYGFGYFNWHSFRLSLTYGNWAINHFPWSKATYPDYGFPDGQFRLIANWIW